MEQVSQAPSFNRRYFLLGSLLTCHLERPRVRHLTTNTRHYMYAVYHMVYALGDKDDSKCTYYYRLIEIHVHVDLNASISIM